MALDKKELYWLQRLVIKANRKGLLDLNKVKEKNPLLRVIEGDKK